MLLHIHQQWFKCLKYNVSHISISHSHKYKVAKYNYVTTMSVQTICYPLWINNQSLCPNPTVWWIFSQLLYVWTDHASRTPSSFSHKYKVAKYIQQTLYISSYKLTLNSEKITNHYAQTQVFGEFFTVTMSDIWTDQAGHRVICA